MNRTRLIIAVTCLVFNTLFLSANVGSQPSFEEQKARINKILTDRITELYDQIDNLTEEQSQEMLKPVARFIIESMSTRGQMQKLREEGASRSQMQELRVRMQGSRKSMDRSVRKILDEEQQKQFTEALRAVMAPPKRPL